MSDEVDQWLEGLGLGALAPAFAENEIAFDYLRDLTNEDLKDARYCWKRSPDRTLRD